MKIKSSQPRRQRKFLYTAPLHLRRKMLSAHLSKELRQQYKKRSLSVRKGDEVQIMRGEHVGKTGKISRVDLKKYKVYIEGVTIKRTDGTERQIPIHPSNLKIINLNLEDERRAKKLGARQREVKDVKAKTFANTEVLESTEKSVKMDSGSKTRTAQKV